MADREIGASRINITADSSSAEAGINRAKAAVKSLADESESSATRQVNASTRTINSLKKQVDTYGLSREELVRYRIASLGASDAAKKLSESFEDQVNKQKRLETKAISDELKKQIETYGLSREELIRYKIASLGAGDASNQLTAAFEKQLAKVGELSGAVGRVGNISSKQYNNALRMLPAQFNDIGVSLLGGQNPFLVLAQQAPQITESFGGVKLAAKAVGGAILGIVNPVTVTAAAVAVLGAAAYKGSEEMHALSDALISTGNSVGLSKDQLADMATGLDDLSGVTVGKATEALAQFAATGAFTGDQLKVAATAALEWQVATGQATEETLKGFVKLADDPVKALLELNKQMGFLDETTLKSVQSLQEQGKITEAATMAIQAYADTLSARSGEMVKNIGSIERGWRSVKQAVSEAWDFMKSVGRENTASQNIARLNSEILAIQAKDNSRFGSGAFSKDTILKRLEAELAKAKSDEAAGAVKGQSPQDKLALAANVKLRAENLAAEQDAATKSEDLATRLAAMKAKFARQGVTDNEAVNKAIARETDRFNKEAADKAEKEAERLRKKGESSAQSEAARINAAKLSAIKATETEEKEAVSNATKELQAKYAAREVSANDYYKQLGDLARQSGAIEEEALRKEIALLDTKAKSGKDAAANAIQRVTLEKQLGNVQGEVSAKLAGIAADEQKATQKRIASMEAYRAALKDATFAIQEQFNAAVRKVGSGDKEYEIESKINDALADRAKRLREIALAQAAGTMDDGVADANAAAVKDETERRIEVIKKGYADLDAAQGDAMNGLTAALANYGDQSKQVASQIEDALQGAFTGLEDVFVEAATTGKISFKSLADSVIADLARITAKQAVSGLLGMFTGGSTSGISREAISIPGFSDGGHTGYGSKYEPKGVVHAGEIVWSQENISRAGGVAVVEAMRLGRRGYSSGGVVGMSSPSSSIAPNVNVNIVGGPSDATVETKTGANGDMDITVLFSQTEKYLAGRIGSGQSSLLSALKSRTTITDRK